MMSFRALLAAAPLLALAVAQNIAFTSTPYEAVAGESYNITWGGGDGTGATLTLRRGNPQDLRTITTLADGVTDNYYVWSVPATLESGDDYAFQITQGQSDINYSGLFTVSGGSVSAANSTSASSAVASSTASDNSTASITSASDAFATGTAAVRNSTFSSATLSSTTTGTYDFNDATTTSTRSSATRTPSSASTSTSAPSNDAPIRAGSSAALILGIVAAVMLH